ncbi:hypothetical protein D3C79_1005840 [compost metagenome]
MRCSFESEGRDTEITLPSCSIFISWWKERTSSPLGPLTVTLLSAATVTVTLAGTSIIFLPTRDI